MKKSNISCVLPKKAKLLLPHDILNIHIRFNKLSIKYSHGISNVIAFIYLDFIYCTIHHESKTFSNFGKSGFVVKTSSYLTLHELIFKTMLHLKLYRCSTASRHTRASTVTFQ
jgi:hypothetical protein